MPEISGIYFKEEGKGFPVILIHGFCETHQVWNSLSRKLAGKYRVLSIDLPGFGASPLLNKPFTIEEVATNVLAWLQSLRIDSCFVVGHSLGGYVTLAMVSQQPNVVKGFSLFHSTAFADTEEKKFSRNKVIEFVSTHGVAPFIESFIPPLFYNPNNKHIADVVDLALGTEKETLLSYVAAMRDRPDRTDVLTNFRGPILFISGEKDTVIPKESSEKQAQLASNSSLFIMPDVAHMGMFEDEVNSLRTIHEFLTENCR